MHLRKTNPMQHQQQQQAIVEEKQQIREENEEEEATKEGVELNTKTKSSEQLQSEAKKATASEKLGEEALEKDEDDIVTPLVSLGHQSGAKNKRQHKTSSKLNDLVEVAAHENVVDPSTTTTTANKKVSKAKASISSVMSAGNPLMMLSKSNSKVINEDMALTIMKNIFK